MPVYHTTLEENRQSILSNGLKPSTKTVKTLDALEQTETHYTLPKEEHNPLGYATTIILTVLEDKRPQEYPKHHNSIFFFPTEELIGELDRSVVFEVSNKALEQNQPIYQAPFDLVTELFFTTMKNFEISNQINIEHIHGLAGQYWTQTKQTTSQNLTPNTEIFVNTNSIEPTHLTDVSKRY